MRQMNALSFLALGSVLCSAEGTFISTYFAQYAVSSFAVSDFNVTSVSAAEYFAAGLAADGSITELDDSTVKAFVAKAHAGGINVTLTIGGWFDSVNFSTVVGDASATSKFLDQIDQVISEYGFNGIELDWEYPGQQGAPGNTVDTQHDVANYVAFLAKLRKLQPNVQLSIAGYFKGLSGLDDYTALALALDYLVVMAYDMESGANTTSPTAPLRVCNDKTNDGSVAHAIENYISKGFPAEKLVLGIPTYGHIFALNHSVHDTGSAALYQPWAPAMSSDEVQFSDLIAWQILQADGVTVGINGTWSRNFDHCTATPFLIDNQQKLLISYDDAQSVNAKAKYARQQGLRGVIFFAASGDHNGLLSHAASQGFASGAPVSAGLIGGIIGAIVAIALLLLGLAAWHKRRRINKLDANDEAGWRETGPNSPSASPKLKTITLEDYYARAGTVSLDADRTNRSYRPDNLPSALVPNHPRSR